VAVYSTVNYLNYKNFPVNFKYMFLLIIITFINIINNNNIYKNNKNIKLSYFI